MSASLKIVQILDDSNPRAILEELLMKRTKLTAEEKAILAAYESGNYTSLPDTHKLIEKYARYAKYSRKGVVTAAQNSSEK